MTMTVRARLAVLAGVAVLAAGVWAQAPPPPPPGAAGLGQPIAGLASDQLARFRAGQAAFGRDATARGGLGPVFTDTSCAKCHNLAGAIPRTVTRIGRLVNGLFDPMVEFGGPLIQNRGIGRFNGVNFVGEVVPPQATIVAQRRTTPLYGLGLVDAVPDQIFLDIAHNQAMFNPTIAGRPHVVIDPATGHERLGKFGWKAQQPTLFAFAADALANEMGVTTPVAPDESCPQGNCRLLAANPAATTPNDPSLANLQQLNDFMTLLAPPPTLPAGRTELAGSRVFGAIGCADCHTRTLQTGLSPVAALSQKTFAPYSDFLLHDMGGLADGLEQNGAGRREMKTAPLWGLRFQPTLLHDGRARTARDAILAHDGQGRISRDRFNKLSPADQAALLTFLNSL